MIAFSGKKDNGESKGGTLPKDSIWSIQCCDKPFSLGMEQSVEVGVSHVSVRQEHTPLPQFCKIGVSSFQFIQVVLNNLFNCCVGRECQGDLKPHCFCLCCTFAGQALPLGPTLDQVGLVPQCQGPGSMERSSLRFLHLGA